MSDQGERCDGCKFFEENIRPYREGECRRHAPIAVAEDDGQRGIYRGNPIFPLMAPDDWCGDWVGKPSLYADEVAEAPAHQGPADGKPDCRTCDNGHKMMDHHPVTGWDSPDCGRNTMPF